MITRSDQTAKIEQERIESLSYILDPSVVNASFVCHVDLSDAVPPFKGFDHLVKVHCLDSLLVGFSTDAREKNSGTL